MAFDLDLSTVRLAAQKHVANPLLTAKAANFAKAAKELAAEPAKPPQKLAGLENNIYFQIALVMLMGLLAKNAILIVEFAVQRRRHGESIVESAINGARARLRPILMTSFAFILGLMPLAFASGVGSVGNRSIATGAAFGLLIGTIIGVFVIPVLYVIFQSLQEKVKPMKFEELKN